MKKEDIIKNYVKNEFNNSQTLVINFIESKTSYFDQIDIYIVELDNFKIWVLYGEKIPMNYYPFRSNDTTNLIYYLHIGFMAEYCSKTIHDNFLINFINEYNIFPIVSNKLLEISKKINPSCTALELQAIANMLREILLTISSYVSTENMKKSEDIKNGDYKNSIRIFLNALLPGSENEYRRDYINKTSDTCWNLISILVHKKSINLYDILNAYNLVQLVSSILSNYLTSTIMPFNKVKCPYCHNEKVVMIQNKKVVNQYTFRCKKCKENFIIPIEKFIMKSLD